MFNNLSDKLNNIFTALKKRGALKEEDVTAAMREIRIALLEADVALPVVKEFIDTVKEKAIGQEVVDSVTPAQMVVKIVHDQLVAILGAESSELNLKVTPPAVILMAGLQGSGKTTSSAKLAKFLKDKQKKKVMMASLDVYRPAAQEQLKILGASIDVETLSIVDGQKPLDITKRALKEAKLSGMDVLILDTAGRLHVDDALMDELIAVHKLSKPAETLLVADAMTGQDAVNVAKSFHERLTLTGTILTRVDGDARGGAALSMRQVTGCPIKFAGMGEKVDQFEIFHPDRIAGRILGMGDIVGLVEKAAEAADEKEAAKLQKKIQRGSFDLGDMESQLNQMLNMGGMGGIMKMIPGMGNMQEKLLGAGIDDKAIKRQIAIIRSMTPKERKFYKLLNASRKRRIAAGAGVPVQDINRLIKQYEGMHKMMKKMKKLGKKGMLRGGLEGLFS